MHWIVQDNMYNEDGFKILIDTLDRFDIKYSVHKIVPFVHELVPEADPEDERVMVMGAYTMSNIARARGWKPGVFLDNLDFQIQYKHWGDEFLNSDAIVTSLADAGPFEAPKFIRPTSDGKSFSGQVMDGFEFEHWKKQVLAIDSWSTVTGNTEIMICSLKKIYREIRNWVINGKVITSSGYKMGNRVYSYEPDQDEIDYAQRIADMWSPNEAYCLDIASTKEGLKIVEVNNLNSSGFYGANMQKLVMTLEESFG